MKKVQLFICAALVSVCGLQAQSEAGPFSPSPIGGNTTEALFDFQLGFDVGSTGSIGADGNAGVIFINNQYWVSAWASDLIHILDVDGNFVETIIIPTVSGTRSITSGDGSVFIGTAGLEIFIIDPVAKLVDGIISITTSSDATARMCTYDETLDGGNGGFWIGNFGSDIASVDTTGAELSVIPATTHNTVIYGGAVDNVSPGGPFLWISDQTGTAPDRASFVQLDPATGMQTGVSFSILAAATANLACTEALGGGLYITDEVVTGTTSFVTLGQTNPSNVVMAFELAGGLGTSDNALSTLSISPNPANGAIISINTASNDMKNVAVYNMLGKKVIEVATTRDMNISSLTAGVYLVNVTENNVTATKKLIVQ